MRERVLLELGQSAAFLLDLSLDVLEFTNRVGVGEVVLPLEVSSNPFLLLRKEVQRCGLGVGRRGGRELVAMGKLDLLVLGLDVGVPGHRANNFINCINPPGKGLPHQDAKINGTLEISREECKQTSMVWIDE
jgi:hypothetical protein